GLHLHAGDRVDVRVRPLGTHGCGRKRCQQRGEQRERPAPDEVRHRFYSLSGPAIRAPKPAGRNGGDWSITTERYREAGVDIDAGNALVEAIKPAATATARVGSMGGLGGFGALFDLKACGYRDPILVATTDGVGTKLVVATEFEKHDTIGQD